MSAIQSWLWAGISKNNLQNISPARITNGLALVVFLLLILQLPVNLMFLSSGGLWQALLILLHVPLFAMVPWFNDRGFSLLCKTWLILCYCSYILASAWHLGGQSHTHYFLLLGLFVTPFIFKESQRRISKLFICILTLLFIIMDFVLKQRAPLQLNDYITYIEWGNSLSFALACLLCALLIQRNLYNSRSKLAQEQQRSEQLLLNVLPDSIAQRLKQSNKPVADYFDHASILFADIQNFSQLTSQCSPQALVDFLNDVFSQFDLLLQQFQLEKIKTIGDAYMAVAGVPQKDKDHAVHCCQCAIAMLHCYDKVRSQHNIQHALRLGINSGPVVAGVIGKRKYSYDLWGESVNMAARMESQGQGQRIQVSSSTYELAKSHFSFASRHPIQVKGMGQCQTYWLLDDITDAQPEKY